METLSPLQPLSQNHPIAGPMPTPAPEIAPRSSQTSSAVSKPDFIYKSLLNQHTQKLKKPPPMYQTLNEGLEHQPRFRSTVWVDGVSYTSSNTFNHRKAAEMDVSKLAYIAITQKAKTDALHFVQQDKTFCKSIIAEFAAKKSLEKPVYETTQLEGVPAFRSNLVFNGGVYLGESAKSKREAEQLVARSVVIQYLDSEFGTDMADIVYCKMKQYNEMNKVQEINSVPSGSNVLGPLAGTDTVVPAFISSGAGAPQLIIPQLVEPITPAAPVVIQPPETQVSNEPVHQDEPVSQVSMEPVMPPVVSQVSMEPIMPPVAEPLVVTPVPSDVVNDSCTPVVSAPPVETPAAVNVIEPSLEIPATVNVIVPKVESSLEYIPLVAETSDKKRSKSSRKKDRKKMRANAEEPVVSATNEVLPFPSQ